MTTKTRPKRPPKFDRFTAPQASPEETRCHYALAPFDELGRAMEAKWGIDRLPGLVRPETAARWATTITNLNQAIAAEDPGAVTECVQSAIRGLRFMDGEAHSQGHEPAEGDCWQCEVEGFRFFLLKDDRQWPAAQKRYPGERLFTLREVAVAMKALRIDHPLVSAAKDSFPGAEIISIAARAEGSDNDLDDEIPF